MMDIEKYVDQLFTLIDRNHDKIAQKMLEMQDMRDKLAKSIEAKQAALDANNEQAFDEARAAEERYRMQLLRESQELDQIGADDSEKNAIIKACMKDVSKNTLKQLTELAKIAQSMVDKAKEINADGAALCDEMTGGFMASIVPHTKTVDDIFVGVHKFDINHLESAADYCYTLIDAYKGMLVCNGLR